MDTIREVLANGDLIMRQQMIDFEQHLASFVGTGDAVGVSNCTDGLRLILEAAGIGPGDEVITVAHTFVATMVYAMQTAAEAGVAFMVLDRPNPIGGRDVDIEGPNVEAKYRSFVGAFCSIHESSVGPKLKLICE